MTCAMPRTPLSGVRISWLIWARKSDFTRVADSAVSLASVSIRSFSISVRSFSAS